jgi:uncharacterized membrane protein
MTWMNFWYLLPLSSRWMTWNLFLALLPLAASFWLFRMAKDRSILWWSICFIFVAFLPNAPYILTDLIHLVEDIQEQHSLLFNTLVIIPKYFLFVVIGFEAYVLSLVNLGHYLQCQGLGRWVLQMEVLLHGLSAIGIYLGRFERFNSWDLMTRPYHVIHSIFGSFFDRRPLLFMILSFVIIAGLYWGMKQITVALMLQKQYRQRLKQGGVTVGGRSELG